MRLIFVLITLALVAAACSSDDDSSAEDSSAVEDGEGAPIDGADAAAVTDPADAADGDTAADPSAGEQPALYEQVATALLGGTAPESDVKSCLEMAAEPDAGDTGFVGALDKVAAAQEQLTDEEFTSLVMTVRDCAGADAHNAALTTGVTFGEDRPEVSTCLADAFAAEGDGAVVALSALVLNVPISPEAQEPAVGLLATCVPDDILATQYAGRYESQTGFSAVVDVDCLTEGFATLEDPEAFWQAFLVSGDAEDLAAADALAADCATDPIADLLQEVPGDFVPWAGTDALAGVAPAARNDAYDEAPPMTLADGADYGAVITTPDGEIVLDLYEDSAPLAVNNFVSLVRDGFYDGTTFHRVLPDFMAQGGDPTGTGSGGPGYSFADEVDDGPGIDRRGLLAMANSGADTNGSQFFITLAPADYLTGKHTVFGELVEGDDVLAGVDLRDPDAPAARGEIIESITITEN